MGEALITRSGGGDPDSPKLKWITMYELIVQNTMYTVPANIRNSTLHVRCFGGGAGVNTNYKSYAGGGGGNMNNADITVAAGTSVTITIGDGGISGDGTKNISGGTTSFGVYLSATGGQYTLSDSGGWGGTGGGGSSWLRGDEDKSTGGGGGVAVYGGGGGASYYSKFNTAYNNQLLAYSGFISGGIYGGSGGTMIGILHSFFNNTNAPFYQNTMACSYGNNYTTFNKDTNTFYVKNGKNMANSSETYENGIKINGWGLSANCYNANGIILLGAGGGYGGNGGQFKYIIGNTTGIYGTWIAGGGGGGYGGNGGVGYIKNNGGSIIGTSGGGGGGYGGNGGNGIYSGSLPIGGGGGGYGPSNYGAGGYGINGYNGKSGCVVISYQQLGFV